MDFLQNLDFGALLLLAVGCIFALVVLLLLVFGLQLIGTTFSTIAGLFGVFGDVVTGGPLVWCGCLVLLFICFAAVGGVLLVTTCNTDPNAMNFCLLFR